MRVLVLLLAVALLSPPPARGDPCPGADPAPALAAIPLERRVAFVRSELEAERGAARAWSLTFAALNGGFTVGQLALTAAVKTGRDRTVLLAGAAASGLGLAQILLAPIPPSARDLAAGGERCAELIRLERALARSARNERLGSGLAAQAGNLVLNAALGALTWHASRRAPHGLLTFAGGWALGEVQILAQPTGLAGAVERYRAGAVGRAPVTLLLAPGPGVVVRAAF